MAGPVTPAMESGMLLRHLMHAWWKSVSLHLIPGLHAFLYPAKWQEVKENQDQAIIDRCFGIGSCCIRITSLGFQTPPAIHTTIDSLEGCMGKPAVAFYTHGGRPGQTDETFKKWIEASGMITGVVTNITQIAHNNEKETKRILRACPSLMNGYFFSWMKMEFYPHLREYNGSGKRSYFFDFHLIVGWGTLSSLRIVGSMNGSSWSGAAPPRLLWHQVSV